MVVYWQKVKLAKRAIVVGKPPTKTRTFCIWAACCGVAAGGTVVPFIYQFLRLPEPDLAAFLRFIQTVNGATWAGWGQVFATVLAIFGSAAISVHQLNVQQRKFDNERQNAARGMALTAWRTLHSKSQDLNQIVRLRTKAQELISARDIARAKNEPTNHELNNAIIQITREITDMGHSLLMSVDIGDQFLGTGTAIQADIGQLVRMINNLGTMARNVRNRAFEKEYKRGIDLYREVDTRMHAFIQGAPYPDEPVILPIDRG
jgi:hypothetical protein